MYTITEEHKIDTLHKVQKCKLIFFNTEEEKEEEEEEGKEKAQTHSGPHLTRVIEVIGVILTL